MRCANCLHENRPEAYFCDNCGSTLENTCSNCGTINRPAANFCDHCGQPFPDRSTTSPADLTETESPIPSNLARKLEQARASQAMLGERRVVTMLFCDVVGSTAAAEQLDPEEWTEIINGAFEHMIAPVYRYEGTLARLMGDAILAFFGAPIAHEDDPQRAVLAGLDIVREITPYWHSVREQWGIEANVRVGINTGLVVVGAVGSDLKMEYTALGDAINLAARMEQTAEPGTVQVSEHTYRLAAPLFDWEPLGKLPLKGKETPVQAYRPLGRRSEPGRRRGIEGMEAPLIGRQHEMQDLLDRLATLEKGRGGIVFVTGEAGLGKSRLVREVREAWSADDPKKAQPPAWIETRASSYDTTQAYSLTRRLLRTVIQLDDSDPHDLVLQRVETWAADLPIPDDTRAELRVVIPQLLSDGEQRSNNAENQTESFRDRLFEVLGESFQRQYARSPGIIFIDDLHWADSASLELLQHLSSLADSASLMFIFAARPERGTPAWDFRTRLDDAFHHRTIEIPLKPLDDPDGEALLQGLLRSADLPETFRKIVHAKSEGNPFFIEEIVREFVEGGLIRKRKDGWEIDEDLDAHVVPDNIEALLAARIDRLSPASRQVLQVASVLGRSFSYRVLDQVSDLGDALDPALEELLRSQMLEETARLPEREYLFRQALTQETAYRSILRRQRREIHRQAGEALQTLFPDRLASLANILAFHFEEAGEPTLAARYHRMAGDTAFNLYAGIEAADHYSKAIAFAEQDPEHSPESVRTLFLRRGRACELASRFNQAFENYTEMERWGREHGQPTIELAAVVSQAVLRATPNDLFDADEGHPLIERALKMARELGDPEAESKSLWAQLILLRLTGRHAKAIEVGLQGLEIAESHDLPERKAYLYHDLGYVYAEIGKPNESSEAFRQAGLLWQQLGNLPLLADGLVGDTLNMVIRGEFERAIENADQAYEISLKTRNLWGQSFSKMYLGTVYRELGRYKDAIESAESSLRDGIAAGFSVAEPLCTMQKFQIMFDLGDRETGIALAEKIWESAAEHPVMDVRDLGLIARIAVLIKTGDIDGAQQLFENRHRKDEVSENLMFVFGGFEDIEILKLKNQLEEALQLSRRRMEKAREMDVTSALPDIHLITAEVLMQMERLPDAKKELLEALEVARAINKRRTLWQILHRLSEIDSATGKPEAAVKYRSEARDLLLEIAAHAPENLRETFLAQPRVRSIVRPG